MQEDVITKATNILQKTFGIKVFEPENKKGCYYLLNELRENPDDESSQHIAWSDKEHAQLALDLPEWWQPGKHDHDLVIGAAR